MILTESGSENYNHFGSGQEKMMRESVLLMNKVQHVLLREPARGYDRQIRPASGGLST